MYLIIIKSSFNYYIHIQPASSHTTGAKLQKRVLPLLLSLFFFSCSQHYRCYCFYYYRLYYYYYYFFCALYSVSLSFLFCLCSGPSWHDNWVFFSPSPSFFLSSLSLALSFLFFSSSMLTLFPISKHTILLTGYQKKEHDDERTFRVIVCKKKKKTRARAQKRKRERYHGVFSSSSSSPS